MRDSIREQWLEKAIARLSTGLFKQHGYKVPALRVSVGFPSGRGSKKAIGQHWAPKAAVDGKGNIFVSPVIDDSMTALGILCHELVHAVVGNDKGHGPVFRECALKIGLEGKMTHALPGKELNIWLKVCLVQLGKYPHRRLNLDMGPVKKQTTRLIKMTCPKCGYVARATRVHILEKGPLWCPCEFVEMDIDHPKEDE